jgi:ABC-type multidrug transport system ATPase subunit
MNAISIEKLSLGYGRKRVLEDLSLNVPAGSVTALLGANGAGKTSLLRALAGELRPKAKQLEVEGLDPRRQRRAVQRAIGWVPDRIDLPRWMRLGEYLKLRAPFYPTWDRAEAARLIELFGLDGDQRWSDLSKGQRALGGLVGALATRPRVLLLDEPFSGLDARARRLVFDGVLEHLREDGRTVLLASHALVDVERCADRIVVIEHGRVQLEGELEDLRRRAARIVVTLAPNTPDWNPPGTPIEEAWEQDERRLFYLDYDEGVRATLEADPRVRHVEALPRDLEDVLLAVDARGEVAA